MKSIAVFGATGSIGCTTVKLLSKQSDCFSVDTLTAGSNAALLAKQAIALKAKHVVLADETKFDELKTLLHGTGIKASAGRKALLDAAQKSVDVSVQGIVGFSGVECSILAAKACDVLALANKESLVCAGPLLKKTCADNNTTLLPVDSEHSAIFQCLLGEERKSVERIILTASGGPFLNTPQAEFKNITPSQAAAHPRWDMGQRISIDSASMFNKAMELIEAKELFECSVEQLEVIVQPQSIVHSMVGFNDGAIMAHLGPADMAGAIGYALNYPSRKEMSLDRLDFAKLGRLDFLSVDHEKFPAISLAFQAMSQGNLAGTVFNAAKEQALDLFLAGHIGFQDMPNLVEMALNEYSRAITISELTIAHIIAQDMVTRKYVVGVSKGSINV